MLALPEGLLPFRRWCLDQALQAVGVWFYSRLLCGGGLGRKRYTWRVPAIGALAPEPGIAPSAPFLITPGEAMIWGHCRRGRCWRTSSIDWRAPCGCGPRDR